MSRLHNFTRNLALSYTQLGANVLYSLISVPLILHWLPKAEFGLWALLIQLMGYISLVDLGMTSATARLLVDHKDRRTDGHYGSLVKTAFLVSLVQGCIIFAVITMASPLLASLMKIPSDYAQTFITLMRWQGVITAFGFSLRPLGLILYAHQRADVCSLNDICSLVCQLSLLWLLLYLGVGIYSFVYASAFYGLLGPGYLLWQCKHLGLLPQVGEWGRASWKAFKGIFHYGKDVFLMTLGYQLTMASQTIIVSRTLGLEVAAVWAVGTKMFNLIVPLMCRPYGASLPGLCEMLARGEAARLRSRFEGIVVLTASLGAFLGISLALCNSLFIGVWTNGRIVWSPLNDVLLGLWVFLLSLQTTHCNFVSVTKQIGGMRYVFFVEGCCFVLLAMLVGARWKLPGMIGSSLVCTALFSYQYSLYRSRQYFHCGLRDLALGWVLPSWKLALVFAPLAAIVWFATKGLCPLWRLEIHGFVAVVAGGALLLRLGLPPPIIQDIKTRWPRSTSMWLGFLVR